MMDSMSWTSEMMQGVGGMMGAGMLFMGLGLVVTLLVVVFLTRAFIIGSTGICTGGAARSPEEILKERYAKGEIDQDEYEQKRKDLAA